MIKKLFVAASSLVVMACLAGVSSAQPLPKVEMHPIFAGYKARRPLWLVEAPDGTGRMFLVEQIGLILIFKKGGDGNSPQEFLNIVDRKPHSDPQYANEEGLLSMAFHPGFATNGLFYIYYNQQNPRRSVISEFKVSKDDPNKADMSSERILMEVPQPFGNHKGGEVTFGPDGYLYLALGDGGSADDPSGNGQNTAVLLAKMLRIDVNVTNSFVGQGRNRRALHYGIPADNPFVNEPDMGGNGTRHEIWAYGLRNAWRYSFDRQTGDLWAGDVGQDLWEEIDIIVKGGNYGWNVREGAHHFKPGPEGAKYIEPVTEYPHRDTDRAKAMYPEHSVGSCVIGGYVYRGKKYPSLQGVYIYADEVVGTIWGLRYENGKLLEDGIVLRQPKNIGSFSEDLDGELYVLTVDGSGEEGGIYSLSVAQ